jgi:hypothetical protein
MADIFVRRAAGSLDRITGQRALFCGDRSDGAAEGRQNRMHITHGAFAQEYPW